MLKAEMRKMGSLIMGSADINRVAAGGALAVGIPDSTYRSAAKTQISLYQT